MPQREGEQGRRGRWFRSTVGGRGAARAERSRVGEVGMAESGGSPQQHTPKDVKERMGCTGTEWNKRGKVGRQERGSGERKQQRDKTRVRKQEGKGREIVKE